MKNYKIGDEVRIKGLGKGIIEHVSESTIEVNIFGQLVSVGIISNSII